VIVGGAMTSNRSTFLNKKIMSIRELFIAFAAVFMCGVGVTFLVLGIRMIIAVTSKDTL